MWKKKFIASKWEESKGVIWTLRKKKPSAICHLWSLGFSITFYASFLSSLFLHEMILVFTMKGSSWEPTDSFSKKGLFIGSEIFFSASSLFGHLCSEEKMEKRVMSWRRNERRYSMLLWVTQKTQTNFTCTFTTMMMMQKNLLLLLSWEFSWPAKRLFFKMSHRESHRYFLSTSFPSFPFDLLPYGELKKNHKFPISQLWFVHYYPLTPILLTTLFLSQRIFFMAFSSSWHGIQSK